SAALRRAGPDRRLHRDAAAALSARALRPGDGREDRPRRAADHARLIAGALACGRMPAPHAQPGLLGLGSNVGDRRAHLQAAVDALPRAGVRVLASSSTYDTDPVGKVLEQPSFLNACLQIETALAPLALLD